MTTVINNPGNGESSESAVSMVVAVIVLVIVVALFFIYALPAIRGNNQDSIEVNLKLPATDTTKTTQN